MDTKENTKQEKIVQAPPPVSYTTDGGKRSCKNKRIRYTADPHIEPYKTGGLHYYRYRRGTDKPEHLGTADFIRKAVTLFRQQRGK